MAEQPEVTFIGTATTVLRIGGFTLLTDPNFLHRGQRAYLGKGMWSRRRTDPALSIAQLPALDAVVLSHLHGDHFDRVARRGLDRLVSLPGQHGPGVLDRLLPDVMGTMVDLVRDGSRRFRLYITGDTLNRPQLTQIPERYPDIDAMLIHLGGTKVAGILLTMDARQGCDLVELIRPKLAVPIHYDDYEVFRSPLSHFVEEARRRGVVRQVRTIARGETVSLTPPG
ncbi:MBL fold metallo-hydrolase [Micromonospora costi]|uniref:MBL fold metallo-hydrolase n=1 Tax=Micromonospora costi TaxID=1530042 RepID=UPI0033E8C30D